MLSNAYLTNQQQDRHVAIWVLLVLLFCKYVLKMIIVNEYSICVLPPNIPEIEVQCLSIIYMSSMLLNEDFFIIYTTATVHSAQKVAQSWAGSLVTCENF